MKNIFLFVAIAAGLAASGGDRSEEAAPCGALDFPDWRAANLIRPYFSDPGWQPVRDAHQIATTSGDPAVVADILLCAAAVDSAWASLDPATTARLDARGWDRGVYALGSYLAVEIVADEVGDPFTDPENYEPSFGYLFFLDATTIRVLGTVWH